MILQQVEHASRVHLDIETDDVDAEVERLDGLGAKRVDSDQELVGDGSADRSPVLRHPSAAGTSLPTRGMLRGQ